VLDDTRIEAPTFEYALPGVKVSHGSINIEKNGLYDFLGFAWIADDSKRDIKNKPMVAIEQDGEGLGTALGYPPISSSSDSVERSSYTRGGTERLAKSV
jgi:hypothetical protein